MKRILSLLLVLSLFAGCCAVLSGCQEIENAAIQTVEKLIDELSKEEISLKIADKIKAIQALLAKLEETDLEEMINLDKFYQIVDKYNELEAKAVAELEAMIDKLPTAEELQEPAAEAIQKVLDVYDSATDAVKEKVSNAGALEKLRDRLEEFRNAQGDN